MLFIPWTVEQANTRPTLFVKHSKEHRIIVSVSASVWSCKDEISHKHRTLNNNSVMIFSVSVNQGMIQILEAK